MSDYEDVRNRIDNLEARVESLLEMKTGPQGSRGPAGDITAATASAEKIARQASEREYQGLVERIDAGVNREQAARTQHIELVRGEIHELSKRVADSFAIEQVQDRIESAVVRILAEYGVVSSHDGKAVAAD